MTSTKKTLLEVEERKAEFINEVHKISLGHLSTVEDLTGMEAVEDILKSNNSMTALVRYDVLLEELKKKVRLSANRFVPELCDLLKDGGLPSKTIRKKVEQDSQAIWSLATIRDNLPSWLKDNAKINKLDTLNARKSRALLVYLPDDFIQAINQLHGKSEIGLEIDRVNCKVIGVGPLENVAEDTTR